MGMSHRNNFGSPQILMPGNDIYDQGITEAANERGADILLQRNEADVLRSLIRFDGRVKTDERMARLWHTTPELAGMAIDQTLEAYPPQGIAALRMKPDELAALLQEGATAARALEQSHNQRSKGDDRHEQQAERWGSAASRFERALSVELSADEKADISAKHLTPGRTVTVQDQDVADALQLMLRSPSYTEGMRDALGLYAQRLLASGGATGETKAE